MTIAETHTVRGGRVGPLLRDWRQRRRMSQMELALEAGVSTRHLSFVETGRSRPSAEMVLHLAERLDVPLRERNELLLAAGFAPQYSARDFDDPALREVRDAVSRVLAAHEPYPAIAVDRYWSLVASNAALGPFLEGVAPELLVPPVNTIRLALHPDGVAPRIVNLGEYRADLVERLARAARRTGDSLLAELHEEMLGYPGGRDGSPAAPVDVAVTVGLRLAPAPGSDAPELSFFSTITTFGTAVDVTVSELAVEAFFPADATTADYLRS
ncbi:MAG TPA: helix-turn-helix transcriptional regulator [Solirubrobacteraceae bacterium]|nr:helix-turn-helix transcriptional regulator [Solirubrobacteraceae bacterium]